MQPAVMDQQHDCHGRELLGAGGEAKVGVGVDLRERTQVGHSVPALEYDPALLKYKHSDTGRASRIDFGKYSINLLCSHRIRSYAQSRHRDAQ